MPAILKKHHWNGGRVASIGLICAVLLSGQSFGRSGPPAKEKKAPPSVQVKKADPKAGETKTAKSSPSGKVIHKRIDGRLRNHPFEFDANAKLVCEQTTVTAEPVWRGRERLTFRFSLHNAGTADLKIKAKGG